MKKNIELLAPAGDLMKLKVALIYGADAVFIGGHKFSLRSRASNFTLDDIKEGCDFAHKLNKKVYVTCNIVMHQKDLSGLKDYLISLKEAGVDAIITSSLYMAMLAINEVHLQAHISTQDSILNTSAIKYFSSLGIERVVLARECSLEDIKNICGQNITQIEVFIHGGMCSSYSGKCMLSNCMTNRDANRGGCAHSCRWKYDLYDGDSKLNKNNEYFSMASKDLNALQFIPDFIEMGVDSLKIEGRMKSLNYIACVCKAYRKCIDDYISGKELNFDTYNDIIKYCENRETGTGFLKGNVTKTEQLFQLDNECRRSGEFVGIIISYDKETKIAKMMLRNKITKDANYSVFSPYTNDTLIYIEEFEVKGNKLESYSVANDIISFRCEKELHEFDIIRALEY
ncbi:MAG: U32 family peptidase [Bacilli bacterium]|nr:U32 family peptidase [Bacilli bacterium]